VTLKLARIPGNFPGVLQRLGLTNQQMTFDMVGAVLPVSIVDSDIQLAATLVPPLYSAPASAGELVAPGAGTVLADTGQLPAGTWIFRAIFSNNTGNAQLRLGKRDAANAAYVWSVFASTTVTTQFQFAELHCTVALNERFRMDTIAAIAGTAQGAIFATQVS